jgi:hypothetical protein
MGQLLRFPLPLPPRTTEDKPNITEDPHRTLRALQVLDEIMSYELRRRKRRTKKKFSRLKLYISTLGRALGHDPPSSTRK